MPDSFTSLRRYFVWADNFLRSFQGEVARAIKSGKPAISGPMDDSIFYMSYWYAALNVVVEGYRELKLQDAAVDALLESRNVELLQRYRNGVCHLQKDYFDERFLNFVAEQGTVEWVNALHDALRACLVREFEVRQAAASASKGKSDA